MGDEKDATSVPLSQADNNAAISDPEDPAKSPPSSPNSSTRKVSFQSSHLFSFFPVDFLVDSIFIVKKMIFFCIGYNLYVGSLILREIH